MIFISLSVDPSTHERTKQATQQMISGDPKQVGHSVGRAILSSSSSSSKAEFVWEEEEDLKLHCYYVITASSFAQAQSSCEAGSQVATLESQNETEDVWNHIQASMYSCISSVLNLEFCYSTCRLCV